MRVSLFSLLLPLFFQTLTLALPLTPAQQDDPNNNTRVLQVNSLISISDEVHDPNRNLMIDYFAALQDVLKEVSTRQKWNLDEIRFTKMEMKKIRIGSSQRFEVRLRFGKSRFVFLLPDQLSSWRHATKNETDSLDDLISEAGAGASLDPFVLEGPFELIVAGDDLMSLILPTNTSYTGLKRILVSEGISLDVRRAKEVSLFRSVVHRIPTAGGLLNEEEKVLPWLSWQSQCTPLLPIQITGAASLTAYRTRSTHSRIEFSILSKDTIQLHPDKCYDRQTYKQPRPRDILGLKIQRLEKVLRSLGNVTHGMKQLGSLNARLKTSGMIRFQLEIERSLGKNHTVRGKFAEWRTKPSIERVVFEVTAKIEGEKLKPFMIKKVLPFIKVDTVAWSSLMSNISFTKFPSILVPQEALTLDVKW